MILKPTKEQERVYLFVKKRPENLLIEAFAGCGKTTTILEAVKLIPPDKSVMFLAFNKHIQEELKTKLPQHVRCYTTYGLGLSALKRKYGDKIVFDEFKLDKHIKKKSKLWKLDDEFDNPNEIENYLSSIKKLVNLCRLSLTTKPDSIKYISNLYDIKIYKPNDIKRVLKVLDSVTLDRDYYDFTDMIYLPAIDKGLWLFPQDYIFVDEVQDINRAQQKLIEKSIKRDRKTKKVTGRLISIGDYFQGIYGFTGITDKTFNWFREYPNTKRLPLSISFRCSKAVIKEAQKIVPDIKARDDAPEGIVREGSVLSEAESGDFVLCRTTMPLVKLFFDFLGREKKATIKGSDIGIQLIELIGKTNTLPELIQFWNHEIETFKNDLLDTGILNPRHHSGYVIMEDKINTLLFLAKLSNNVMDLKQKILTIFSEKIEGIMLSTVHKVKGLEADRVFIIRPDLLPLTNVKDWQYVQEKNLEYVAITRAKNELVYDNVWTDE